MMNTDSIGMSSVAFMGDRIFVGGRFMIAEPTPDWSGWTNCNNILQFDGVYARTVGTGLNSNVATMTVLGTNLYVGGLFTNAGGISANQIARWDGTSWSGVGGGVVGRGTVLTLTVVGNDLFAGGTFTNMGGVPASRIARWNGTNWSALGSGVSTTVYGIAGTQDSIYVGGSLRTARGKPSNFIARWNETANFNTPYLTAPKWLGNGGFQARCMGISGLTNLILFSPDLTSWTPILSTNAGIFDFTDNGVQGQPRRFYRAVLGQ